MARKIAFTRVYQNVPIAESVRRMVTTAFPEFEVETFTVTQLLKERPDIMLFNVLVALFQNGFTIIKTKSAFRKAFMGTPYLFKRVRQLVRELISPDLENYAFTIQLQSLFDLSIPGLPNYVYTDHTHLENLAYAEFDPQGMRSGLWLALEKEVYHNAAHLFTRSTNISTSLVQKYGVDPNKITCVYVGANVKTDLEDINNRDYTAKNLLFVGMDWERKGGPDLVAAFERILPVHPDASLTIIGCTPQISTPNTYIVGYLPPDEVKEHYRRASLFCLPTRLEPFGVVFIEAMSYGLPVLATPVGAIPDFITPGVNGYLVPPGDVDALEERITTMLSDPDLLRDFGSHSRQLVKEHYNWESVGKKIRSRILSELGESTIENSEF